MSFNNWNLQSMIVFSNFNPEASLLICLGFSLQIFGDLLVLSLKIKQKMISFKLMWALQPPFCFIIWLYCCETGYTFNPLNWLAVVNLFMNLFGMVCNCECEGSSLQREANDNCCFQKWFLPCWETPSSQSLFGWSAAADKQGFWCRKFIFVLSFSLILLYVHVCIIHVLVLFKCWSTHQTILLLAGIQRPYERFHRAQ